MDNGENAMKIQSTTVNKLTICILQSNAQLEQYSKQHHNNV